jgi:hypothetical protein
MISQGLQFENKLGRKSSEIISSEKYSKPLFITPTNGGSQGSAFKKVEKPSLISGSFSICKPREDPKSINIDLSKAKTTDGENLSPFLSST